MASQSEILGDFFDLFYGDQTGYAYSPVKDPESGPTKNFAQHFFHWPSQRSELIQHVINYTDSNEVYYSPALFSKADKAEKHDFLGTRYIFCEFDGNAPDTIEQEGIPEPSFKIRSSESKHQHWYWRLDHFETDINIIETINQRLAVQVNADRVWNANRVLRPPSTIHHESGKKVTTLSQLDREVSLGAFITLKELPKFEEAHEDTIGHVPNPILVIAKYQWSLDEMNLLMTATIESGNGGGRSFALTKVAHYCMEKGTTNAEALSLLLHLDKKWGKYHGRSDQRKRLIDIINYARAKHAVDPVQEEADDALKVYTFDEFMHQKFEVDWVVNDLVHKKGIVMLAGPPNVGKSQVTLRFMQKMATGENFLRWKIDKPRKILFFSMEMPREELGSFLKTMNMEENDLMRENFLIIPIGMPLKLGNIKVKEAILKKMEEHKPDGVIFDSFGTLMSDDLTSDKNVLELFGFVRSYINGQYGAFAWFIHHPRKGQVGNKKPNTLDDLYGNMYIGGQITSCLLLWKGAGQNTLEVSCLKMRMSEEFKPFRIERTSNLDFRMKESGNHSFGPMASNKPIFGSLGDSDDPPNDLAASI